MPWARPPPHAQRPATFHRLTSGWALGNVFKQARDGRRVGWSRDEAVVAQRAGQGLRASQRGLTEMDVAAPRPLFNIPCPSPHWPRRSGGYKGPKTRATVSQGLQITQKGLRTFEPPPPLSYFQRVVTPPPPTSCARSPSAPGHTSRALPTRPTLRSTALRMGRPSLPQGTVPQGPCPTAPLSASPDAAPVHDPRIRPPPPLPTQCAPILLPMRHTTCPPQAESAWSSRPCH